MRNVIKRIANIVFVVVVLLLAAYTFLMAKYPEETAQITGYRLYAVLTDSMEPRIPTFSLVCTEVLDPEEPLHLKKGDIITFKADRFGDDILLTHHFNKTEKDFQGNTIYRTNAEGKDNLDMYKTLRKDIIGTYVLHIPFIGKIFLFLKSKFGILLYAELAVIWLFNKTIRTRWAEKEQVLKKQKTLYVDAVEFEELEGHCVLSGELHNDTKFAVRFVKAEIQLYDEQRNLIKTDKWFLTGKDSIPAGTHQQFNYTIYDVKDARYYKIHILSYKK